MGESRTHLELSQEAKWLCCQENKEPAQIKQRKSKKYKTMIEWLQGIKSPSSDEPDGQEDVIEYIEENIYVLIHFVTGCTLLSRKEQIKSVLEPSSFGIFG